MNCLASCRSLCVSGPRLRSIGKSLIISRQVRMGRNGYNQMQCPTALGSASIPVTPKGICFMVAIRPAEYPCAPCSFLMCVSGPLPPWIVSLTYLFLLLRAYWGHTLKSKEEQRENSREPNRANGFTTIPRKQTLEKKSLCSLSDIAVINRETALAEPNRRKKTACTVSRAG